MNERQLKKIFREAAIQGHDHTRNIERIYKLLREAAEAEFTEDNAPTLDGFLAENFLVSLNLTHPTLAPKAALSSRYDIARRKT